MSTPVTQYLDTDGDGTGTNNAIGDYTTPDDFYMQPAAGEDVLVARLIVHIADATIKAGDYGALSALSNGVDLTVVLDGTTFNLDGGVAVTTNAGWGSLCFDVEQKSWSASPTQESLVIRYTFDKFFHDQARPASAKDGILLQGHRDDKLVITLSDNLTGLAIHRFMAQGTLYTDHISAANAP